MLSTGSASTLGRSTIVMAPMLANGMERAGSGRATARHGTARRHLRGRARDRRRLRDSCRSSPPLAWTRSSASTRRRTWTSSRTRSQARLAAPPPETEIRLLWKWFRESPERALVMHCVRNGFRLDVWSIRSRVFSACRKTLQNRMSVIGLPSPGILSRCGRVLHAQELERLGVRPTSAVADTPRLPVRERHAACPPPAPEGAHDARPAGAGFCVAVEVG